MELAKYAVTAVLVEGRSIRSVAASTGRSKSWVARHVALYRSGGDAALVAKKRGPVVGPRHTSPELEDEIIKLRKELAEAGWDAGAKTLAYHLGLTHECVPSLVTIHRILVRRGFVTPQPQKRPRSSWTRFESDLPNECWQSDMTHWQLEDDTPVEIINFIDDCSRAVLCSVVVPVATAAEVARLFHACADQFGYPTSVLSDNGAIYTTAYRGSHSALELDLAALAISFKHGKPYHPQTQGKVSYGQLSVGAREQLCILTRLACAAIVSRGGSGGAPVIIDDALGWSDRGRLEGMGAAIATAAQSSQVIILTCEPGRYTSVGNAVVRQLVPGGRDIPAPDPGG